MKIGKWVVAAAVAGLVPLQAARAQTYCYPGQLWTCFSYQLTTTANAGGGTDVVLKVRNESVAAPGGQASWLVTLGFYAPPNIGTPSGLAVTAEPGVNVVGSPGSRWHITTSNGLGLPMALEKFATGPSQPKQGDIMGCGTPGGATIFFGTCAPAYPGFVIFSFHTSGSWDAGSANLAARWQTSKGSFDCSTAPQGVTTSVANCGNVVPEPVTMALLGTGLIGLGGAGLVRRRRKNGDITNG